MVKPGRSDGDAPDARYEGETLHRVQLVKEMLEGWDPASILDLGCGSGELSAGLASPAALVTLVDISPTMIERASSVHSLRVGVTRAVTQDVVEFRPTQVFDLVLCIGLLAHVDDVGACLARAAGCTAQGGRLVVQLTNPNALAGRLMLAAANRRSRRRRRGHELSRLTEDDLVRQLARHGLVLVSRRAYLATYSKTPRALDLLVRRMPSWLTSDTLLLFRAP
ncbi:MAG: class I SAM-dependent methyltransferase [Acidimicrobiales bacterium]